MSEKSTFLAIEMSRGGGIDSLCGRKFDSVSEKLTATICRHLKSRNSARANFFLSSAVGKEPIQARLFRILFGALLIFEKRSSHFPALCSRHQQWREIAPLAGQVYRKQETAFPSIQFDS